MNPIAIYLLALLTLTCAMSAQAQDTLDALDLATGHWGIDVTDVPDGLDAREMEARRGCFNSPVIITADRETMRYTAVHTGEDNFTAEAPILDVQSRWISLRYDDEDRLLENGEPAIWHMYFVDEDRFYWVAGETMQTREWIVPVARIRCKLSLS